MSSKQDKPYERIFQASGRHIGDGWVLLTAAHPKLQQYFYSGLILLKAVENCPANTGVHLVYTPTKKSMKLVDYHIDE